MLLLDKSCLALSRRGCYHSEKEGIRDGMKIEDTDKTVPEDQTMMMSADMARPDRPAWKASLVVLSGWEIGRKVELSKDEHVFGRSGSANTRINSPSVSREHARIIWVPEGGDGHFQVSDLQSSNGTRVNGMKVDSARLNDGDKVLMGDVLFKFVVSDEDDSAFYHNVHRLIHYDQLTGLFTMDAFRNRFEAEIQRSGTQTRMTIAMTDLDGLKRVNDTYGHLAGRMVIREMGVMMRDSLRTTDVPGLYGGDEAIILFPETPITRAAEVAEAMRRRFESRVFEYSSHTFKITISQGLAEWPTNGKTLEQVIAVADQALYTAKAAGRNCVRCATP